MTKDTKELVALYGIAAVGVLVGVALGWFL